MESIYQYTIGMIQPIERTCASFEQLKTYAYLTFVLGNLPHLKAFVSI